MFEIEHFFLIHRQMGETEVAIADKLEENIGPEVATIRIVDLESQSKNGVFYNNFVYSTQIGDSTVHFTIGQPADTVTLEKVKTHSSPIEHSSKTALLKSMFKEFTHPCHIIHLQFEEGTPKKLALMAGVSAYSSYTSIQKPPPEFLT